MPVILFFLDVVASPVFFNEFSIFGVSKWLNAIRVAALIRGRLNPLIPSLTDRTHIIERILEAAQGEAGLTERKIMYEFSLPNVEVDLFLSTMIRNELITFDFITNSYRTTEKGLDFLESISKMYELDDLTS